MGIRGMIYAAMVTIFIVVIACSLPSVRRDAKDKRLEAIEKDRIYISKDLIKHFNKSNKENICYRQ